MIVIAIIAILAAFAIPAYQDYTKRTYVAEGLVLASAAKLAITEFYAVHGSFSLDLGNNGSNLLRNENVGLAAPTDITGQAVASVEVNGVSIQILYNEKVAEGARLTLQVKGDSNYNNGYGDPTAPNYAPANPGSIEWGCRPKDGYGLGTNIVAKWLPASCRV
jgi:type IV pilus assembly protein PilA